MIKTPSFDNSTPNTGATGHTGSAGDTGASTGTTGVGGGKVTLTVSEGGQFVIHGLKEGAIPELPLPQLSAIGVTDWGLMLKSMQKLLTKEMLEQAQNSFEYREKEIEENFKESIKKIEDAMAQAKKGRKARKLSQSLSRAGFGVAASMAVMAVAALAVGAASGGTATVMMVGMMVAATTLALDETGNTEKFQQSLAQVFEDMGMDAQTASIVAGVTVGVVYMAASIGGGAGAKAAMNAAMSSTQSLLHASANAAKASVLAGKTADVAADTASISARFANAVKDMKGGAQIIKSAQQLGKQADEAAQMARNASDKADDAIVAAKAASDKADEAAVAAKEAKASYQAAKEAGTASSDELLALQEKAAKLAQTADQMQEQANQLAKVADKLTTAAHRYNKIALDVAKNSKQSILSAEKAVTNGTKNADEIARGLDEAVEANTQTLAALEKLDNTMAVSSISLDAAAESMGTVSNKRMSEMIQTADETASNFVKEANKAYVLSTNFKHVGSTITRMGMAVEGGTTITEASSKISAGAIEYKGALSRADAQRIEAMIEMDEEMQKMIKKYMESIMELNRAIFADVSAILKKEADMQINISRTA